MTRSVHQQNHQALTASVEHAAFLPSRLTIFAFFWACQALVHQEFYSGWLREGDLRGWFLTGIALATLLRPSSILFFSTMLISSIVYNVAKWPFVVNHILLESIINATILGAIGWTLLTGKRTQTSDHEMREQIFDRFAPVVWVMLVVMYGYAFLAKLNYDFINPDVSCVVFMYADLLERFPFLPNSPAAHNAVIVLTLLVEAVIPLLLCFRRTRPIAILIGLPFHFVLGLVGHRTFSALAYTLYMLPCLTESMPLIDSVRRWFNVQFSTSARRKAYRLMTFAVPVVVACLIGADLAGHFRSKLLGVSVYQIPWLIWILWSLCVGTAFAVAFGWRYFVNTNVTAVTRNVQPGLLWLMIPLVAFIGLSQYLGLKTETCFTMYSNLRTEGHRNNHFFMPVVRLGQWQDDLVSIVATNHPDLVSYTKEDSQITFFELRRIVASSTEHFRLEYERGGEQHLLAYSSDGLSQSESWGRHPELLGRLLCFRPVPTGDCVPCQH